MKNQLRILIVLLLVIACKEESNPISKIKEAASAAADAKTGIENLNEVAQGFEDLEENIKELSEITPVTKEQIKAWMPKEVADLKRTAFTIGSQMGISTFKLTFKAADGKKININISDGAGKGAAIISMFIMAQNIEIDKEDESGYERTQTFDGQKTLIKYRASKNYTKASLQCLLGKRFGIEANAWEMTPEELWSFIKQLEIEELMN